MIPVIRSTILIAFITALGACGGGGGTASSGGIGGTGVTSTGVMTSGSIIVNGVEYFDDTADKNVSDDPLVSSRTPDDGKVVKLRGRRNDNGVTGTADSFEIENEVRGTVQSTSAGTTPQSFKVVNQNVIIDDLTICKNFTLPASSVGAPTFRCDDPLPELGTGTVVVEVHGLRLADGSISASRIERLGIGAGTGFDELRGTVASAGALSFILVNGTQNVTVNYGGTPVVSNDQVVEVHGTYNSLTNEFTATRVDIEDLEDAEFEPQDNGEIEVEGYVSGCPANDPCGSATFSVGNRLVQMTTNRFENGDDKDLVNGVRIEAEGHFVTSSGTLMADKIKFKRVRVELVGDTTFAGGGNLAKGDTLDIMGVTIKTDLLTSIVPRNGGITNGEPVEVRGYLDSLDQVIAVEVKELSSSGDEIIRAPVTSKISSTLKILGVNVLLTGSTVLQGGTITDLSQFLGLVTVGTTVVKAKGSFGLGTLTAVEAEIED